jgi:hypothetical protein
MYIICDFIQWRSQGWAEGAAASPPKYQEKLKIILIFNGL